MITALVSTVLGLVGGAIPDLVRGWREDKDRAHELAILDRQASLAAAGHTQRLDEIRENALTEEMRAWSSRIETIIAAGARPSGVRWIDGFNAMIRPSTAAALMLLFVATAGIYLLGIMDQLGRGVLLPEDASALIWGSLLGEAIQAVLGYLFGYRTTRVLAR